MQSTIGFVGNGRLACCLACSLLIAASACSGSEGSEATSVSGVASTQSSVVTVRDGKAVAADQVFTS